MVTTTAFLNALPPARLAQADLGRFLTRTLARRPPAELPAILEILATTPLSGYPDALGPVLRTFIEVVLAEHVPLDELHPEAVEGILGSSAWQAQAQSSVDLRRSRLRPGEVLSDDLRAAAAGARELEVLDGEGPSLVLVAPVTLTSVDGLGWLAASGPVVVRPAEEEEASALRRTWGRIEELHGWDAEPWVAAFVAISTRPNLDAARCARALDRLEPARRASVWGLLVEHTRRGGLLEEHRPSPRQLARTLAEAGAEIEDASLAPLVAFARRVYETCAPDPGVSRGVCPCTRDDLETYAAWTEVSEARRARLLSLDPRVAAHRLRVIAVAERASRHPPLGDEDVADLRALRDAFLRPLYERDVRLMRAVDPLALLQTSIERGEDRAQILADLRDLEDRAVAAVASGHQIQESGDGGGAARSLTSPHDTGQRDTGERDTAQPDTGQRRSRWGAEATAADGGGLSGGSQEPAARREEAMERGGADVAPAASPYEGYEPAPLALPPLPPPPRPARARPPSKVSLPPLPTPPARLGRGVRRRGGERRPAEAPPGRRGRGVVSEAGGGAAPPGARGRGRGQRAQPNAATPNNRQGPAAAERGGARQPRGTAAARATTRAGGTGLGRGEGGARGGRRPVTPAGAERFYDQTFRELEVLERDLLERGPWPQAAERLEGLVAEARALAQSLGPSARSGDREFAAALTKIERVQVYLDRVVPLAVAPPEAEDADEEPLDESGMLGKLGRLWRRKR